MAPIQGSVNRSWPPARVRPPKVDCVPTERYEANSAWQLMSILAFDLMRDLLTDRHDRMAELEPQAPI